MSIELQQPLSKLKEAFNSWLYLENDTVIDVIFATHIVNQVFDGDPVWLMIIGPPSNSKTEILRALSQNRHVYSLSTVTNHTFLSAYKKKGSNEDHSLLPKITGKTLILKDFTSILTMHRDTRGEILGQLREIYDGYTSRNTGSKTLTWSGKLGLIAACTEVYDNYASVITTLGDRFLLYRSHVKDSKKMGEQAIRLVGRLDLMRNELQEATSTFLAQFEDFSGELAFKLPDEISEKIVYLAMLCAYGRCPVERDRTNKEITSFIHAEGSSRLTIQMTQLGQALALLYGKDTIDEDVYSILALLARGVLPAPRMAALKHLFENKIFEHYEETETTREVAEAIGMPTSTSRYILEDLMVVGLLTGSSDKGKSNDPWKWCLNKMACSLLAKTGALR